MQMCGGALVVIHRCDVALIVMQKYGMVCCGLHAIHNGGVVFIGMYICGVVWCVL